MEETLRAGSNGEVDRETRVAAVVRLLAGESIEALVDELGVEPHRLDEWRRAFLDAGSEAVAEPETGPVDGRSERAARTRARLVQTAIECLAELGYAGTSTNIIAQRAGLSRGAQLYHFPTRIDLLVGAIDHLLEERSAELTAKGDDILRGTHRSAQTIDLLWTLFEGPLFYAILELMTAARTDDELADRLRPTVEKLGEQLYAICRQVLGDEVPGEDVADAFVDMTVMLMYGMAVLRILDRDDDDGAASADERYEGLLDVWKYMVDASIDRLQREGSPSRS